MILASRQVCHPTRVLPRPGEKDFRNNPESLESIISLLVTTLDS
jgi:hypothetical protein